MRACVCLFVCQSVCSYLLVCVVCVPLVRLKVLLKQILQTHSCHHVYLCVVAVCVLCVTGAVPMSMPQDATVARCVMRVCVCGCVCAGICKHEFFCSNCFSTQNTQALHWACALGREDLVALLLDNGADPATHDARCVCVSVCLSCLCVRVCLGFRYMTGEA